MPHYLQDLKTRLASSSDCAELMGDFFDLILGTEFLGRSVSCELPRLLETTFEGFVEQVLGRPASFSGVTLRCGEVLHGAGFVPGAQPFRPHPLTFVYDEDLGLGLICISSLPGGENRYARFRHLPHRGGAILN